MLDVVILGQAVLSIVLLGSLGWSYGVYHNSNLPTSPRLVYSPLQDVIEYRIAHFTETPGENPVVRMPESNNMDTWEELFESGVVRIPQEQARRLAEPSLPIPGDEDYYMISIEVFRQLHCLNMFAKMLHPEDYPSPIMPPQEVVDHCIDSVRQSLMCSVDVNPLVWQWSEERQEVRPNLATSHTCRNFDKIEDWVKEHRLQINISQVVPSFGRM